MAEPRYPLLVALPGGRVQHSARLIGDGPAVTTLCRKRATPTDDGSGLPYCRGCADRPNPISQQSGSTRDMTAPAWPFGTDAKQDDPLIAQTQLA